MKLHKLPIGIVLALSLTGEVWAKDWLSSTIKDVSRAVENRPVAAPAAGEIEVGFSPDQGAEALVLKAINAAKKEIRVLAYSFTSPSIVRALLDAKHRGVDVRVVADYKNNVSQDSSGKAKHALSALVNAGIPTRTIKAYPIHHDKTIIIDQTHVETGSFNFSDAAARRNSENVLVIWNNPKLATTYLAHWQSRFDQGQDFQPGY